MFSPEFWGEYVYKKNPRKPLHLTQTQLLLTLHHDLSIPVAYCFHKLEIPEFSVSNFLCLESEKLTHYHIFFLNNPVFKVYQSFLIFFWELNMCFSHITRIRNSQQTDFIMHIPETCRSHMNMLQSTHIGIHSRGKPVMSQTYIHVQMYN